MSPLGTLLTLLCLLGALQGLLLGIAVGTLGEGPRRANRVLSLILVISAAVLVVILLSHRTDAGAATALELVEYSMWLFAGPFAYIYVSLAVTADRAPARQLLPHLVPGLGGSPMWRSSRPGPWVVARPGCRRCSG